MPRVKYPANEVGLQIRKERERLGYTQEEFATRCQLARLDISRSTLAQIELRMRFVTAEELGILAALLGVTMESLFPAAWQKRFRGKKLKPKTTKSR